MTVTSFPKIPVTHALQKSCIEVIKPFTTGALLGTTYQYFRRSVQDDTKVRLYVSYRKRNNGIDSRIIRHVAASIILDCKSCQIISVDNTDDPLRDTVPDDRKGLRAGCIIQKHFRPGIHRVVRILRQLSNSPRGKVALTIRLAKYPYR